MKEEKLIPPDLTRCQTEITVNRPFVMGGSVKEVTRCEGKPVAIAIEPPRADGKKQGSMALCFACTERCRKQMPGVTFEAIP